MFLLRSDSGTTVVTDPFETGCFDGALSYDTCGVSADVVTVSHDSHADHNAVDAVAGSPAVFRGAGAHEHKDVRALGVATFHDASKGSERGENTVFRIEMDGLRIVHLGDLGHELDEAQVREIGEADVVLAPFGGFFTIDGHQALRVARSLGARVVVPMHFKTSKVGFPIQPADDFLGGDVPASRPGTSEVEVSREGLPAEASVWILDHAG
jgi:L-ascorbate metabolism protein UlaG (beta-lactamase superfamily)